VWEYHSDGEPIRLQSEACRAKICSAIAEDGCILCGCENGSVMLWLLQNGRMQAAPGFTAGPRSMDTCPIKTMAMRYSAACKGPVAAIVLPGKGGIACLNVFAGSVRVLNFAAANTIRCAIHPLPYHVDVQKPV
jgi:hypothetical protein